MKDLAQQRSPEPDSPTRIRIATYNVHSCVGTDRRFDPERIAGVVEELRADVIALQEMLYPSDLAIETRSPVMMPRLNGYQCALGPTHARAQQLFGNVLLTRFPIRDLSRIDLSAGKREPRGALHVVLDTFGTEFHVITTHLGLHLGERRAQVDRIVEAVNEFSGGFLAVIGDFNDWAPGRSVVHVLDGLLGSAGSPRSFPARWPLLALDRVWIRPRARVLSVRTHITPLSKKASDHLPVVAEVELGGTEPGSIPPSSRGGAGNSSAPERTRRN